MPSKYTSADLFGRKHKQRLQDAAAMKQLRERTGLTQQEWVAKVGQSPRTVSRIETGITGVTRATRLLWETVSRAVKP